MTPEMTQAAMWSIAERHVTDIIGGCCGTTDAHIRRLAEMVEPIKGLRLSTHSIYKQTSRQVDELTSRRADKDSAAQQSDSQGVAKGHLSPSERPSFTGQKTVNDTAKDGLSQNGGQTPAPSSADAIFDAILKGKADQCVEATRAALAEGAAPQDIINGQMIRAMGEVGQRFQDGKAFVPQLLMAGRAMKAALELLKPMLAGSASTTIGRVVIGTVKGDLHDIGKNLVASMLEGSGFEVDNIGIDVPSDKFVEAVKSYHADILCMSALLTTTMTYMKDVIRAIEDAGLRDKVKIMVGGAPVSQAFAEEIGADGYSDNANEAVKVAKILLGK
ncbi:cobalamin B12-binding domain-containing protein [Marseilla massiliensis]|uniref:Cobalamin B12-binding domain-containing protein n=1 Tax=Marseilla massiliensis TaxID=1841864 RepID=A0A938WUE5_9BACT|nr:cobalamin B12-binding domain-containing protein [Marseilla massiliensis]